MAANRWEPVGDPGCDDDYTDLDLDRWAADLWAEQALGVQDPPWRHSCDVGCEEGCLDPFGERARADAGAANPIPGDDPCAPVPATPPTTSLGASSGNARAGLSTTGEGIPAGTAYVTTQVAERCGTELAEFLDGLPPLSGLDGWSVIEVMKGFEKVARWAAAGQAAAVAEIARRYPDPRAGWAREAEPPISPLGEPIPPAAEHVSGPVFDQATTQVALALDLPRASAQGLLVDAVALTDRLPLVLNRLSRGMISARVAHVLAEETAVCADAATAADVAEHVLAQPGVRTGPQARRAVASAVIDSDPAAADRRERAAVAGRSFRPVKDTTDGMVTWDVTLPVAQSLAIDTRLSELAKAAKRQGDRRSRAAARADIATAALLGQPLVASDGTVLSPANLPTTTVWRTDVVVPLDTLAGGRRPGYVPGWGPVTGATARHLATGAVGPTPGRSASLDRPDPGQHSQSNDQPNSDQPGQAGPDRFDPGQPNPRPDRLDPAQAGSNQPTLDQPGATLRDQAGRGSGCGWPPNSVTELAYSLEGDSQWRRLVTDPLSGTLLDYGTTRYRPPAPLDRFVRARDARCYEPGCTIPAADCDLDHIKPSPVGPSPNPDPDGATADWNLGAGCRTAHRVKAMPGWSMTSPSAGTFIWTTPTGHRYTRHPEPALPPPVRPRGPFSSEKAPGPADPARPISPPPSPDAASLAGPARSASPPPSPDAASLAGPARSASPPPSPDAASLAGPARSASPPPSPDEAPLICSPNRARPADSPTSTESPPAAHRTGLISSSSPSPRTPTPRQSQHGPPPY